MSGGVMTCTSCGRAVTTAETYGYQNVGDAQALQWLKNNIGTICGNCQKAKVAVEGKAPRPILRFLHR